MQLVKRSTYQSRVALDSLSLVSSPERRRQRQTHLGKGRRKTKAEIGAPHLQAKEDQGFAAEHRKPEREGGFSPVGIFEGAGLSGPLILTSGLQNCETINSLCFKSPVCGTFLCSPGLCNITVHTTRTSRAHIHTCTHVCRDLQALILIICCFKSVTWRCGGQMVQAGHQPA